MNNSRTHYVEKLTIKNIINAKQSLIKLHRSSVTFCRADKNPYRHDGRADKDSYPHDRRAYSLSRQYFSANMVIWLILSTNRLLLSSSDLTLSSEWSSLLLVDGNGREVEASSSKALKRSSPNASAMLLLFVFGRFCFDLPLNVVHRLRRSVTGHFGP